MRREAFPVHAQQKLAKSSFEVPEMLSARVCAVWPVPICLFLQMQLSAQQGHEGHLLFSRCWMPTRTCHSIS